MPEFENYLEERIEALENAAPSGASVGIGTVRAEVEGYRLASPIVIDGEFFIVRVSVTSPPLLHVPGVLEVGGGIQCAGPFPVGFEPGGSVTLLVTNVVATESCQLVGSWDIDGVITWDPEPAITGTDLTFVDNELTTTAGGVFVHAIHLEYAND